MVTILEETTKNPITMIGKMAGVCWGSDINDETKNYNRGLECLRSKHGRTFEFPDVYMSITGHSARVIREWYTHIGGLPTRLQESTRYIDYKDFDYVVPESIKMNNEHELGEWTARKYYKKLMQNISETASALKDLKIPQEDIALILPLGMVSNIVCKHNLRNLIDMSRQRMCSRAYHEYRDVMKEVCDALSEYSDEWKQVVAENFHSKCVELGYCPESKGCGRYPNKEKEN